MRVSSRAAQLLVAADTLLEGARDGALEEAGVSRAHQLQLAAAMRWTREALARHVGLDPAGHLGAVAGR